MAGPISVALCTYNGQRFITEQLQSITGQTRPVEQVVICDDASTDSTTDAIRSFAASSSIAVQLHVNDSRLGVTRNFQKAISLCTGELIVLSDQDDRWRPDKIARLTQAFTDDSVGLAFSNAQVVREDLSPARYRLWNAIWFSAPEQRKVRDGDAVPVLLRHAVAAGSTLAFRSRYRSLLLPIPDFPHSHDIWIALLIACVARLAPIDEDLVQYRLHSSNQVGLRRYGLLGQLRMARRQVREGAFAYAADLHHAAYQRLAAAASWPVRAQALALLQEKIQHSRLRSDLPPRFARRLRVIGGELRKGNYSKYSYGFKSVLQDLVLR